MDESVETPDQPLVEYVAGKSAYNQQLDWRQWALFAIASPIATLALACFIGIGAARQSSPALVLLTPAVMVYAPAMLAAFLVMRLRLGVFSVCLAGWSGVMLAVVPVYFPGERADAIATGIAMITRSAKWEDMARSVASPLEDVEAGLQGELISALRLTAPPDRRAVDTSHRVSLPLDEKGHVQVTLRHGDRDVTLSAVLDPNLAFTLIHPDRTASIQLEQEDRIDLDVASGSARTLMAMHLVDELRLGAIGLPAVAVGPCDPCSEDLVERFAGADLIIGQNVLDAIVWEEQDGSLEVNALLNANRRLDIAPFVVVDGRFARYPRGLVQVRLLAKNQSHRPIRDGVVRITCGANTWLVSLGFLGAGDSVQLRRRLPQHGKCGDYHFDLESGSW